MSQMLPKLNNLTVYNYGQREVTFLLHLNYTSYVRQPCYNYVMALDIHPSICL